MGITATMKWADTKESEVRSYCRNWPVVFDRARGSWMYDEEGRAYLDFFWNQALAAFKTAVEQPPKEEG